jgi:SAM-dependent methyltransferase
MYNELTNCRLNGSKKLTSVLNLGNQYLTGVFPKNKNDKVSKGPLELVWCEDSRLLQLNHSFPFDDGSFDIIIANQILEHTIELFWIFHEITRVLKKGGGKLIIGVPNLASLHNRFLLSIGRQPTSIKSASAHIRGFTKPDMVCFVNTCWPGGYKLVKWGGSNFYPFHQLSPNLWRRCFLPWHGDYLCSLKKTANTMMNLLSFQSMKILKPTFL